MKNNNQPMFTICIPAYNRAHLISRTLDSLVRQTYKDFEVVVVDDGSTDNTAEVVQNYTEKLALAYIKKENGGKHTALNVGIEKAKGYFFMILDSDDFLVDDALEKMLGTYNKIPEDEKAQFCGVIGKSKSVKDNLLGDAFPYEGYITSYIDYHFIEGKKKYFDDCCECIKTELIKPYRFPEPKGTNFVPEYWLFDQIGCKYKLYSTNTIIKMVEYQTDGISMNADVFYRKNWLGCLYGVVTRIDVVFPQVKIPMRSKIEVWLYYWTLLDYDTENIGPRVKSKSPLKLVTKMYYKFRTRK